MCYMYQNKNGIWGVFPPTSCQIPPTSSQYENRDPHMVYTTSRFVLNLNELCNFFSFLLFFYLNYDEKPA